MNKNLLKRIVTGSLLLAGLLLVLWVGGHILVFAAVILVLLLAYEYFFLATPLERSQVLRLSACVGLMPLCLIFAGGWSGFAFGYVLALTLTVGLVLATVELSQHEPPLQELVGGAFLGVSYVGVLGTLIVSHAMNPSGAAQLTWLLILVATSDTAAFLVGRLVGGRQLAPRVSPNKTVSGAVGGLVGAVAAGVLAAEILHLQQPLWWIFLLSALAGMLAQLGDLFESLVKRMYGVKDSGSTLPGHGGLLDRFDSCLLSSPILFFLGPLAS